MEETTMDINELQRDVKELVAGINRYHQHPNPQLISYMKLLEEVGEVSQVMLASEIPSRKGLKVPQEEIQESLGLELADTLIALVSVANDYNINLAHYVQKKLDEHHEKQRI